MQTSLPAAETLGMDDLIVVPHADKTLQMNTEVLFEPTDEQIPNLKTAILDEEMNFVTEETFSPTIPAAAVQNLYLLL